MQSAWCWRRWMMKINWGATEKIDPALMKLLGRLKTLAKPTGIHIDLVKMTDGSDYAAITLKELSLADEPELVLIVIKLMNLMGLIEAPVDMAKVEEKQGGDRYVGSLR
jgi:hypothetical protein